MKPSDPKRVAPLPFDPSAERFLKTYLEFKPTIPHDLLIVNCGGEGDSMFSEVATMQERYNGGGYDCGTYQAIGSKLKHEFVLALNSHCHFWRHGWLEKFQEAFSIFGEGVYGASGSYERNPHIRTPAIAFPPKLMRDYPETVDTREKAIVFEGGTNNCTVWAQAQGYPATVVAVDGFYSLSRIKAIQNGFRRGDQSAMLIKDRHCLVYDQAAPEMKKHLESVVYSAAPNL